MKFEPYEVPAPEHSAATKCGCSCCADAVTRAEHDRNPFAGCNCHDYPADQRCDCQLCEFVTSWGGAYFRSVNR